mmetsp:Transcript_11945/g.35215  ORF Transcript_11945/g.35215 Transcript_11945/m.35215 type:complete len:149 (+) Transcript_11945:1847-2293(+)
MPRFKDVAEDAAAAATLPAAAAATLPNAAAVTAVAFGATGAAVAALQAVPRRVPAAAPLAAVPLLLPLPLGLLLGAGEALTSSPKGRAVRELGSVLAECACPAAACAAATAVVAVARPLLSSRGGDSAADRAGAAAFGAGEARRGHAW